MVFDPCTPSVMKVHDASLLRVRVCSLAGSPSGPGPGSPSEGFVGFHKILGVVHLAQELLRKYSVIPSCLVLWSVALPSYLDAEDVCPTSRSPDMFGRAWNIAREACLRLIQAFPILRCRVRLPTSSSEKHILRFEVTEEV